MVYAIDKNEFESLKSEMITKAKGLGYDDVVAFGVKQVEQLFRARAEMNAQLGE